MREAGTLAHDTLVATVMSNLGLRIAMKQAGIRLVETKVGDRYVLEAMRAGGHAPEERREREIDAEDAGTLQLSRRDRPGKIPDRGQQHERL